ncbi:methyl-accepting chemotaxis protein [Desulfobaculum sp. SPO524]|uniref:methyl-accepting chemotaxis protein n=1 Tax=Desulfobaculum sp. SPO524 TaxID=3378071 RepID=UPI0038548D36
MGFYSKSLRLKIIVPISIITIFTFAVLGVTNSAWHRHATTDIIHDSATRIASTLLSAIEEPMAIGDNEGTQMQLRKVAASYSDVTVFLTNFKGNITYSTDEEAVRKDLATVRPEQDIQNLLSASLTTPQEAGELLHIGGRPYFVAVNSIPNEPSCHHCHGASQPILGSMVLMQDVSPQFADLWNAEKMTIGLSLAGAAFLLLALLGFIKRMVISKVVCIADISDRIKDGDYNAEFDTCGDDELASLSDNLRVMVQTVQNQLEYNKSILHGIIIPLIVTDRDERVTFTNEPMRRILGLPEGRIAGRKMSELFAQCPPEHAQVARRVIASGASASGQLTYTGQDGAQYPLHYEVSPLTDANDAVVGAIATMIDLTQEEADKERIRAQRENLLHVADDVTEVATALTASADQLAHQMQELMNGMEQTSAQTGQVAAAMEEMNATVLEVAQNAGRAAEASTSASGVAKDGGQEVENTVMETRQMAETTQGLAQSLGSLSERAEDIGHVMNVINDIADQTNLLALNAAIEAARAGEAGRGFAVVADEVRKLAEKTMQATREVDGAIRGIQESAHDAVSAMDQTRDRATHTQSLATNAGSVLTRIVSQSDSIADMVRSIATAADQQSSTSDEINANVSSINQLSQDISQRISTANASIQDVAGMAKQLSTLVEKFRE